MPYPRAVEIARGSEASFDRGDEARFTGEVWLRSAITAGDGRSVAVVHFSPGARTHWHRHPGGQFLYALTGHGRVRSRGEPGHLLEPGDVIHVAGDAWHFHGGAPDAPVVHVAINGPGTADWGDAVTDDDYGEGF
jgi:quercetin dioxygenase-like cupin family protein